MIDRQIQIDMMKIEQHVLYIPNSIFSPFALIHLMFRAIFSIILLFILTSPENLYKAWSINNSKYLLNKWQNLLNSLSLPLLKYLETFVHYKLTLHLQSLNHPQYLKSHSPCNDLVTFHLFQRYVSYTPHISHISRKTTSSPKVVLKLLLFSLLFLLSSLQLSYHLLVLLIFDI